MERLGQSEQLVAQLKEMIRERDAALRSKDEQLKVRQQIYCRVFRAELLSVQVLTSSENDVNTGFKMDTETNIKHKPVLLLDDTKRFKVFREIINVPLLLNQL